MGYYDDDYASKYTDEQTGKAQGRGGYSSDYGYGGDNNDDLYGSYYQSGAQGGEESEFDWDGYFAALEENVYGGQQVSGEGEPTQYGSQPTQYGDSGYMGTGMSFQEYYGSQIAAPRESGPGYHGGGGGSGGGGGGGDRYSGPTRKLDLSGIDLDLPEYDAPKEDPAIYKHEYETVYQRTKAPVEQGVSEAIMSSKSLNNPMARMDFVRKALSGYGEALTGIASAAHSAAQEEAARQYTNQMQEYQMQYKADYAEAVASYEKELQAAISNWEQSGNIENNEMLDENNEMLNKNNEMWDDYNQKLIDYYG